MKNDLCNFSTRELTLELMKREAVVANEVEPYENMEIEVNGPAIVLVVYD